MSTALQTLADYIAAGRHLHPDSTPKTSRQMSRDLQDVRPDTLRKELRRHFPSVLDAADAHARIKQLSAGFDEKPRRERMRHAPKGFRLLLWALENDKHRLTLMSGAQRLTTPSELRQVLLMHADAASPAPRDPMRILSRYFPNTYAAILAQLASKAAVEKDTPQGEEPSGDDQGKEDEL